MKGRSWQEWACIAGILNGILFVALTTLAMLFYAGGSKFNINAGYYDFFQNYFSDLGRVAGFAGQENLVPMVLFNLWLCLSAACYILFFLAFQTAFVGNKRGRGWVLLAVILGIIGSGFMVGIAFAPVDVNSKGHNLAASYTYFFMGTAILIATGATWKVKAYPRVCAWMGVLSFILILTFALCLTIGGNPTPEWLLVNVTLQKMVEYSVYLWSSLFPWFTLRVLQPGNPNATPTTV